jgi:Na+-transporting methylmalonyl-CoA/oxaloacetate decarboxylase gamma subunit
MMSTIQQGLLIAVIGMGLVFSVIIFLWGLMALLVRLTSSNAEAPQAFQENLETTAEPLVPQMKAAEDQRRAAAAAVAVAMALAAARGRGTENAGGASEANLSPWQAVHRVRQLQNRIRRG